MSPFQGSEGWLPSTQGLRPGLFCSAPSGLRVPNIVTSARDSKPRRGIRSRQTAKCPAQSPCATRDRSVGSGAAKRQGGIRGRQTAKCAAQTPRAMHDRVVRFGAAMRKCGGVGVDKSCSAMCTRHVRRAAAGWDPEPRGGRVGSRAAKRRHRKAQGVSPGNRRGLQESPAGAKQNPTAGSNRSL